MGRFKDLTGRRFGRLTAIAPTKERTSAGQVIWKCRCDCGEIYLVCGSTLSFGTTKSCGCMRSNNLMGRRFGKLTAIAPINERSGCGGVTWKCRCDCGRESLVAAGNLMSGHTQSCGCLHREVIQRDITGRRFGRLTAIAPTKKRSFKGVVWKCRCDCGKEVFMKGSAFTSGKAKSCGCLTDITGRRFGRLTAFARTRKGEHGNLAWKCRCDCGKEVSVVTSALRNGSTKSCGCLNMANRMCQGTTLSPDDIPHDVVKAQQAFSRNKKEIKSA